MNSKGSVGLYALLVGSVLLIAFVIAYMLSGGASFDPPAGGAVARDFNCDVVVDDAFALEVDSVSCQTLRQKSSCGFFSSLGFLSEKGQVQIVDSRGVIETKNFETPSLATKETISISECTYDTSITVRVLNEDGNLVEARQVSLT